MPGGTSASILWMLLSALASAALAALAHALGSYVGWQGVLLSRTLFGLLFSLWLARATRSPIVILGPWYLWLRSLAGGIGILLGFYAYTRLPAGDALVLNNTSPIWFALFAWTSLGHRSSRGEWVALASGLAGVALVARPHLEHHNLAVVAAFFTGITSAIALRALSRLRHVYRPATILVHHAGAALLTAIVLTAALPMPRSLGGLGLDRAGPGLLLLGLLGTLGQYASTRSLASGRAVRAAAASYAGVGFGVLFDHVFWPAPFDPWKIAGMILILAPLSWLVRTPEQALLVLSSDAGPAEAPLALGPAEIAAIERVIARARRSTSCPIRFEAGDADGGDARAAATARFAALGMERTALHNGVLLYVSLADGQVALAVDHGITEIVPAPALDAVCRAAQRDLRPGAAGAVSARAVDALARLLAEYFPAEDTNGEERA